MKIKFEPRDVWIGIYWTKSRITTLDSDSECYSFYICIIPCLPIIFNITRQIPKIRRQQNW